jgi:hypothetical protein
LRCHKGKCQKCPPKTKECGDFNCCEHGEECCNGKCCGKRQHCCFENHCCDDGKSCCGEKCCDEKEEKCCGDHCCKKDEDCCGPGCCPKGKKCAWQSGKLVCCGAGNIVLVGSRQVCCGAGQIAVKGRCCPKSIPNCAECDPACHNGEFCRDGVCIPTPF